MRFQNTLNVNDFVGENEEVLAVGNPRDSNEIKALVKCIHIGKLTTNIKFEVRETSSEGGAIHVYKMVSSLDSAVDFYNSI